MENDKTEQEAMIDLLMKSAEHCMDPKVDCEGCQMRKWMDDTGQKTHSCLWHFANVAQKIGSLYKEARAENADMEKHAWDNADKIFILEATIREQKSMIRTLCRAADMIMDQIEEA